MKIIESYLLIIVAGDGGGTVIKKAGTIDVPAFL
jgi:hypothetical protein